MINEAVKFLAEEVNKYLSLKLGIPETDKKLVTGNIARAFDGDSGGMPNALAGKAVLSVVNIEEDRIAKDQLPYVRTDSGAIVYKNPAVHLNLYLLFSVNISNYMDALQCLRYIIQFFQSQTTFTPGEYPTLNSGIQKLIADLYTLSAAQVNHLWGTLGGKSLPSALYKVRMVTIDNGLPYASGEVITEIHQQFPAEHEADTIETPPHEGIGYWKIGTEFVVS